MCDAMATGILRVFIAVDIPNEIKNALYGVANASAFSGIRIVPKDNMHITLVFLGSVKMDVVDDAKTAIENLKIGPFSSRLESIKTFGKKSNVAFAEVAEGNEGFLSLNSYLMKSLSGKVEIDNRFMPHVTIARGKDPSKLSKFAGLCNERWKGMDFRAENICIKRSTLSHTGPAYDTIFDKAL